MFEGEKYVSLAYKYRLIDQNYKLAVLDRVVCHVEYLPDGHGRTMWREYAHSPRGFAFWRKVCMQYPESKKRLVVDNIHYVSSSFLAGDLHFLRESPTRVLTALAIPFGFALSLYTKHKAGKK